MLAAPGDLVDEVEDQPLHPGLAALGVVRELEHVAHPTGEGVGELARDPEDVGDDADRDLLGVADGGIDLTGVDEAVDQPAAQLACHLLVGLHAAMGEPGQQQPA